MAKAKNRSIYVCQNCGAQRPRWEGRCADCGAWNSLVEERPIATGENQRGWRVGISQGTVHRLSEVVQKSDKQRWDTGFQELNRLLGGGLVRGSYVLLGGDPGVGKSTLLLQLAGSLGERNRKVLYVSAEESIEQTSLRAHRLGIFAANVDVASENQVETILELAEAHKPQVMVVDSIQTVFLSSLDSAPGSVSQVRESAGRLMNLAKTKDVVVILVGHVTKEGSLAGPKVLEHMVDTVLSFEGDTHHQFRILRATKNRFGAINELAVFQMESQGLTEVLNPSELFLSERTESRIGASVFSAIEGSRPILCEVQALAAHSPLNLPRRTSLGFDINRVHMLVAVLDKFARLGLSFQDIYINVAGGLRLTEPAADLAVAAALISSLAECALSPHACFVGEVGLTGEVRGVTLIEDRVREAIKLGFQDIYVPAKHQKALQAVTGKVRIHYIDHVQKLLSGLIDKPLKRSSRAAAAVPPPRPLGGPPEESLRDGF